MTTYVALIDSAERAVSSTRERLERGADASDLFPAEEEIEVEAASDEEAWRRARQVIAADHEPGVDVMRVFPI